MDEGEGAASSVSSFMNLISFLDKTTYLMNTDIEIMLLALNFLFLFFSQIPEENRASPKPS